MKKQMFSLVVNRLLIMALIVFGAVIAITSFNRADAAGMKQYIVVLGTDPNVLGTDTLQEDFYDVLDDYSADIVYEYNYLPMMVVEIDESDEAALAAEPQVLALQENEFNKPSLASSVPVIGGDTAHTGGDTGTGQAVAIIDSGVSITHPAIDIIEEACFSGADGGFSFVDSVCPGGLTTYDQTGAGTGTDCNGTTAFVGVEVDSCDHGTHVAGIATGSDATNDGVAPDSGAIAIQTMSNIDDSVICAPELTCGRFVTSDYIKGLEYVLALHNDSGFTTPIASVNMSIGGALYTSQATCDSDQAATKVAIDALRSAGIPTIIASGNDGSATEISSPACVSSAIAVGSTTDADAVSSFTNSNSMMELLAPGSLINAPIPGGTFDIKSGTSMASPHVAGAIAVLRAHNSTLSVSDILDLLEDTGTPVLDPSNGLTFPRIDLQAALDAISDPTWDGGGSDNNWSTPENWSTDLVPEFMDDVTFDGTSSKSVVIDTDVSTANLNVTVAYTGDINASAADPDVNVNGNAIFNGTGNLNLGTGTWEIFGVFDIADQGSLTHLGSTVKLTSTASMLIEGVYTLSTLEVDATGLSLTLSSDLDLANSLIITNGTVVAGSNGLTIGGSILNSGTLSAASSPVILNGGTQAITGSNTFGTLTKTNGGMLTLASGTTQSITGALSLAGVDGNNLLTLNASTPGSAAMINPSAAVTANAMEVQDSNNLTGIISATASSDLGNNTGWLFSGVKILQSGAGTTVSEAGTTDTYTVQLSSEPTADVTFTLTDSSQVNTAITEAVPSSDTVCFTNPTINTPSCNQWDAPALVTVSAVDDESDEGSHMTSITHEVTSSDVLYNLIAVKTVNVTITDNDGSTPTITDTDGDGVSDSEENGGPNGGDGNYDGIADSIQSSVASASNDVTGGYTTMEASGCTVIDNFEVLSESDLAAENDEFDFPGGLNSFSLTCPGAGATASIKIYYSGVIDADTYQKVSADETVTDITDQVTFAVENLGGADRTTVAFDITDGGSLDQDGAVDASITDPSGFTLADSDLADTGSSITTSLFAGLGLILAGVILSIKAQRPAYSFVKKQHSFLPRVRKQFKK